MGDDLRHSCLVQTRKIIWLIGLVFASVLILQYFEPPYRDRMLSLVSSGKSYFIFPDSDKRVDGDLGYKKNESYIGKLNSSSDQDGLLLENTVKMNHSTIEHETIVRSISIAPEQSRDSLFGFSKENGVADVSPSTIEHDTIVRSISIAPELPRDSLSRFSKENVVADVSPFISPSSLDVSVASSPPPTSAEKNETRLNEESSKIQSPSEEQKPKKPVASVVSISDMNDLLLQSRVSSFSTSPLWPSPADQKLLEERFKITNAAMIKNRARLYGPIYRNLSTFVRSYEIMEKELKIYVYNEGTRPVFHQPRLKGIYASEGWFMKHLKGSKQFVTSNPNEAHLFYLPFSSQLLAEYVYVPNSHSFDSILKYLKNYLETIQGKHSFWNRTDGADHFVVACHDWAAFETRHLMPNCIRALCNSDVKEGFRFGKDVSLPETYVHSPLNPLQRVGGQRSSERKILAFFAGQMHGYVRPILLKHWQNTDPDMKIFGRLQKGYDWHMKNSKYCICAKGYEVNSPRVVEAIIYGCVPVIISDNFVPPFFDILKWESFAVFVPEKDIPNLKNILVSISETRYAVLQQRVKQVRQHFLWHKTPQKYDIFHMILHSIWYNRVFRLSPK